LRYAVLQHTRQIGRRGESHARAVECWRGQEQWLWLLATAILLLATALLIDPDVVLISWLWPRWFAIMTLSWWLPGFLLLWRWHPPGLPWPAALLLGVGLGWCWQIALLIALHWLPGPLSYPLFVGAYAGGAFLLLALCYHRPLGLAAVDRRTVAWLLLLLVIAVALRLPDLGAYEFHQDETHLLRRANEAIRGGDAALARHTKGIGEIAVVMVVYRAGETINEWTARLPFALASVGSVVALGLLGWRMFNGYVGFAAGLLLAFNGFALGLSRIAQYQGAVLLLSLLVLLTAWEFAQQPRRFWLAMTLLLSAFGVVMHYEFVLNSLPLLLLLIIGWRRAGATRPLLRTLLWTGMAGGALVAATYLPLLLNPYFATTRNYLASRIEQGQANNFAFFANISTLYNSIYFAMGLLLLVLIGLISGWRQARRKTIVLVLWTLPVLVLYLAVVKHPGTHFYFMMPGWSLLAAVGVVQIDAQFGRVNRSCSWGWRSLLALWLAVAGVYLYILFFRQSPAYLVNYPETQIPFYWAPYGKTIPPEPRFGFPIQEGWKTLGTLADWGYLPETYTSNERSDSLRWYLRGFDRVPLAADPSLIFVADHVQERDPAFDDELLADGPYQRVGEVQVDGQPRIAIWARQPLAGGYVIYEAQLYEAAFAQAAPTLREHFDRPKLAVKQTLGEVITLRGATVDPPAPTAGDVIHLALWWQALQPLAVDYKAFVHIADATGKPVAQWDGLPGQNTQRTSAWPPGATQIDHVVLALPAVLPAGDYTVLVGFYDPATGARLGDNVIRVTTLHIRA
jgi:hypothetical protein